MLRPPLCVVSLGAALFRCPTRGFRLNHWKLPFLQVKSGCTCGSAEGYSSAPLHTGAWTCRCPAGVLGTVLCFLHGPRSGETRTLRQGRLGVGRDVGVPPSTWGRGCIQHCCTPHPRFRWDSPGDNSWWQLGPAAVSIPPGGRTLSAHSRVPKPGPSSRERGACRAQPWLKAANQEPTVTL